MTKKYDLGKKSDMRKFQRDLEKTARDQAKQAFSTMQHQIECPGCKTKLKVSSGVKICPSCGSEVNFTIDFKNLQLRRLLSLHEKLALLQVS